MPELLNYIYKDDDKLKELFDQNNKFKITDIIEIIVTIASKALAYVPLVPQEKNDEISRTIIDIISKFKGNGSTDLIHHTMKNLKQVNLSFWSNCSLLGNKGQAARIWRQNIGTEYAVPKKINKAIRETVCEDDFFYPNLTVVGFILDDVKIDIPHSDRMPEEVANRRNVFWPILIYNKPCAEDVPRKNEKAGNGERYAPIAIHGLNEILFPESTKGRTGLKLPVKNDNSYDTITQKVIVIKGAPGSGKTTFGIQLMVDIASSGLNCLYLYTHDDGNTIRYLAESYGFCRKADEDTDQTDNRPVFDDLTVFVKNTDELKMETLKPDKLEDMITHVRRYSKKARSSKTAPEIDIFFLDSLNVNKLKESNREAIERLFKALRDSGVISFILLEDYQNNTTYEVKQLIADCEFMADVVIELNEEYQLNYHTRCLTIKKKHYGPQAYGKHFYKICPQVHSLSNIHSLSDKANKSGIIIHPSLHKYLSGARKDTFHLSKRALKNTGITHLDAILSHDDKLTGNSFAPNACIVVQGKRGSYDLPIGLNIAIGGLWDIDENAGSVVPGKDVLVILLNEDNNIDLNNEAIAHRTHLFTNKKIETPFTSFDNGQYLKWRQHVGTYDDTTFSQLGNDSLQKEIFKFLSEEGYIDQSKNIYKRFEKGYLDRKREYITGLALNQAEIERKVIESLERAYQGLGHKRREDGSIPDDRKHNMQCELDKLFMIGGNYKQKIIFNKWCTYLTRGHNDFSCRKIVVANFRPGCITPEEFISSVASLLEKGNFSRVLFNSTALIPMRFPLLAKEELFIPALIDLFKSKNVISIFVDPQGKGAKVELSFGLVNLADYLIQLDDLGNIEDNFKDRIELPADFERKEKELYDLVISKQKHRRWSQLSVVNNRGKKYTNRPHIVTVCNTSTAAISSLDVIAAVPGISTEDANSIAGILRSRDSGEAPGNDPLKKLEDKRYYDKFTAEKLNKLKTRPNNELFIINLKD